GILGLEFFLFRMRIVLVTRSNYDDFFGAQVNGRTHGRQLPHGSVTAPLRLAAYQHGLSRKDERDGAGCKQMINTYCAGHSLAQRAPPGLDDAMRLIKRQM